MTLAVEKLYDQKSKQTNKRLNPLRWHRRMISLLGVLYLPGRIRTIRTSVTFARVLRPIIHSESWNHGIRWKCFLFHRFNSFTGDRGLDENRWPVEELGWMELIWIDLNSRRAEELKGNIPRWNDSSESIRYHVPISISFRTCLSRMSKYLRLSKYQRPQTTAVTTPL